MSNVTSRLTKGTSSGTVDKDEPWIGVHVLTEFIFCPRAGIISFEEDRDDPGEDLTLAPRLDYLPDFSIDELERALQTTWDDLWKVLTWTVPAALVVSVISVVVDWRIPLFLIPAACWLVRWLIRQLGKIAELSRRLTIARNTLPREPIPDSTERQPVNWWELLNAGFTPVEYEDPHVDDELRFVGKPWRVLHKGSLRIPVFRKRRGSEQLHLQHELRMAAYAHLIETAEGGQVPYGVILFAGAHDGVTIPINEKDRSRVQTELFNLRRSIDLVRSKRQAPESPQSKTLCHDCPLGRPRAYRVGRTGHVSLGLLLPIFFTRGEDGRSYHSVCGDRFHWVPPHARADEKGLL